VKRRAFITLLGGAATYTGQIKVALPISIQRAAANGGTSRYFVQRLLTAFWRSATLAELRAAAAASMLPPPSCWAMKAMLWSTQFACPGTPGPRGGGTRRPILLSPHSANHRLPSGPCVMPIGWGWLLVFFLPLPPLLMANSVT
jgi:hypothetical protein